MTLCWSWGWRRDSRTESVAAIAAESLWDGSSSAGTSTRGGRRSVTGVTLLRLLLRRGCGVAVFETAFGPLAVLSLQTQEECSLFLSFGGFVTMYAVLAALALLYRLVAESEEVEGTRSCMGS